MSRHISFHEQRDFEQGKPLTAEQKKHLLGCVSCRFYLKQDSWWIKLFKKVKSLFNKKKTP